MDLVIKCDVIKFCHTQVKPSKKELPFGKIFSSSWALSENEKNNQKEPWKRITKQIRSLLENMFHARTVDSNNKISGEEMYNELLKRAQRSEFDQSDIPKVSTINNWIAIFS
ncbi:9837_t:CDS:2, partial [Gigaspora rosea]